ncbi:hypothetical protein JW926_15205 [Candidatus Sumerlaeota bacterium]|nr:hypothetical protein [Candidatus Sumerlaeota bacterium]
MARIRFLLKRLGKPLSRMKDMQDIFRSSEKIAPVFSLKFLRSLGRGIRLCFKDGYIPEDSFRFGLFDPDMPRSELTRFMSKKKMTDFQKRLNPSSWSRLTEDKSLFYLCFKGLGIPMPELYAVYFKETPGLSWDGAHLETREGWIKYILINLPAEFVIKPCRGAFGRKVKIFLRKGREFREASGKIYAAEDIYNLMRDDEEYDRFIIQERLGNHAEIRSLTEMDFLQTIRMVTFTNRRGERHILLAAMRFLSGDNFIDNFFSGGSGNMIAPVCVETGVLDAAKARKGAEGPFVDVAVHPRTNQMIQGFRIPLWEQCCKLVLEASGKLPPIRTIGWDVAVTEKGPVIVEGNMWWNPANIYADMGALMQRMREWE